MSSHAFDAASRRRGRGPPGPGWSTGHKAALGSWEDLPPAAYSRVSNQATECVTAKGVARFGLRTKGWREGHLA
eukprot:688037-Prorocentrum_minimum.AAC.1